MVRHPDDHGPIQNFIGALYSAPFYTVAPRLGVRAGLVNLLILAALLGFISAMRASAGAGQVFDSWQTGVSDGRIPVVTVARGRMSVEGPQPWIGYGPNGIVAIVDTTGTWSGLPDSIAIGLFAGPSGITYRTAPKMLQRIPFGLEEKGTRLDAAGVAALRGVFLPSIVLIGSIVLGLYFLVANGLLVLLLAAPAQWLARRIAPAVAYHEILTLALFVVTPVALLFLTIGLVAPGMVFALWPLYPAMTVWILLGRIRRWLVPRDPPPAG